MEENTTDHKISSLKERYYGITFSVLYESPNGGLVERFNQGVQGKKEKYKKLQRKLYLLKVYQTNLNMRT